MTDKMTKVTCSFCENEMDCPENMLQAKKHMCFNCFNDPNTADKASEKEIVDGNIHIDIKQDQVNDIIPDHVANMLAEKTFPDLWHERKEELKGLSKRDLAKEMFGTGAFLALKMFLDSENELNKKKK